MSPGSRSASALAALAFAAAALWTAAVELAPRPPSVIVLTVESMRAEMLSPEATPSLWAAAQEGTRFAQHRTVSAWTGASIVSLLTGQPPHAHGIHARGRAVPAAQDLPLEALGAAGWDVAGLQPFMLVDGFRNLGLEVAPGADPLAWLAGRARLGRPFVLWYHYLDTHLPYAPPPPFRPDWEALLPPGDAAARARIEAVMRMPAIPADAVSFAPADRAAVEALYRGGFRAFDAWFAAFWDLFVRSGLRERTILVLTADHGEELLERGHVGHASTTRAGHLHEEIVRVPLVVWLPPSLRAGAPGLVDRPTDHLDVMPTLLARLGVAPPRPLAGRDVLAAFAPRPWIATTSIAGFAEPEPDAVRRFVHAYIEDGWKLMLREEDGAVTGRALFDLAADPGERRERAGARADVAARLEAGLRLALASPPPAAVADAAPADLPAPRWTLPPGSGAYRYDDLAGRVRLAWAGDPRGAYVVQYQAGEGPLALGGTLRVAGTEKDFGTIDRRYWDTWIVPYGTFRLRVGVAGRDDRWSEWIELKALR